MNNQDIICIWHLRVSTHFSFTVCQAIWNYAIDCRKLSDVIEVDHLNELEDILVYLLEVGTPPLTRFFGTQKNRVKGKPRYRRSILVLEQENGTFLHSKSTF